ncbi:MAG: hypothetical protein ACUVXI_01490 [bacterium]
MESKRARMDNQCSFKFSHYEETLERALSLGYVLTSFRDYNESLGKVMILRHDVDYGDGMRKAMNFAEIERDLGARATYFIKTHCPEYNPFEYKTYVTLRKILAMGHEIGLHFEAVDMSYITGEDEVELFLKEKDVLERILDVKIISASQHIDYSCYSHPDYHWFFDRYKREDVDIVNYASEKRFVEDMKYLSDSNSVWLEGCFCKHLGKHDKFQILTHPKWWFNEYYHID